MHGYIEDERSNERADEKFPWSHSISSMNRVDSSGFDHRNFQTLVSVCVKIAFVLAVLFSLGRCHLTHLMPTDTFGV